MFPCRERDEPWSNAAGKSGVFKAKAPYGGKGLNDATRDEQRILAWWRQHPDAMIGVPLGVNGCFVVDFDPRIDPEVIDETTGEVLADAREWTLEEMKAELEAMIGCALPPSLTSRTPSGGVHVWYRQPSDGGPEIRNSVGGKALNDHVDVRGAGGYVVAPPSAIIEASDAAEGQYRWIERRGDWRDDASIAEAPPELIAAIREKKGKKEKAPPSSPARSPATVSADVDADVRKYALSALDGELDAIRKAGTGRRNDQLNESAFKIATFVAAGVLDERVARVLVESAARDNPGNDDDRQLIATIDSGWTAGLNSPRDLTEIAAASRSRRERGPPRPSRSGPRPPNSTDNGPPSSQQGGKRGRDSRREGRSALELAQECAFLPMTDLGNLQRFLRRYGADFLHVEAWGWLAWDGKRWSREAALPLLGRAAQDTMRAIQEEADFIRDTGVKRPLYDREKGPKAADLLQLNLFEETGANDDALDYVVQVKSKEVVLFSDKIAAWGRTSEAAAKIGCILAPAMAQARLAAATGDFDADPLALNVLNGTLAFERPSEGRAASVRLREHRREDRMTKIAAAEYLPGVDCPQFDGFLKVVQPSADMRDFLDVWAGYCSLGLADAQKMALFYGEGSNGKGVWTRTIAQLLGDYAWAAGIETFIDQGKYRKGSDASPDLAALAGRRMVYANEPEEGSKFSDGLIKSMTSDEPIGGVRELLKPPFELEVTFTNTVLANNRPKIGTDHGIQRRMQVVPWDVIIPDEEQDLQLKSKLRAEASGILNRMVAGALRYLTSGIPVPEAVREATEAYKAENDILGQFIDLCIARVPGETMGSTALHELFAAWQTWAQLLPATGKPWSPKYLSSQMEKKKFRKRKSSTMMWDDIAARFDKIDFIDEGGKAVTRELPPPRTFPGDPDGQPPTPSGPSAWTEEDDIAP